MTTLIRNDELRHYADTLKAAGFTIYAPGGTWDFFTYSRPVLDGSQVIVCCGTVQRGYFGGFSHTMPIRPSREHGSGMWVMGTPDTTPDQGEPSGDDPLTVEVAEMVARPTNYNPLVGVQRNYNPGVDRYTIY